MSHVTQFYSRIVPHSRETWLIPMWHRDWLIPMWHNSISMSMTPHVSNSWEILRIIHVWMSHVSYEWVISRINESCHTWMSHVTYEWVMSHMNESCHMWLSHVTYDWVTSHMNSHVTQFYCTYTFEFGQYMNESRHIWMSHMTVERVASHKSESCHTGLLHIHIRVWNPLGFDRNDFPQVLPPLLNPKP